MPKRTDNPTPHALAVRKWRAANPEKALAQARLSRQKATAEQKARWNANRDPESVARYRAKQLAKYREDAGHRMEFRTRANAGNYGISPEEYAERRSRPCSICERYDPPAGRGQGMHIDHDHATDSLRGTLCAKCNRGIGMFDDSGEMLRRAADYLDEWKRKTAIA